MFAIVAGRRHTLDLRRSLRLGNQAMASVLKLIEHRVVKPRLRRLNPWRYVRYGDIRVHYKDHLDGGGRTSGLDYLPLFHDLGMPRGRRLSAFHY